MRKALFYRYRFNRALQYLPFVALCLLLLFLAMMFAALSWATTYNDSISFPSSGTQALYGGVSYMPMSFSVSGTQVASSAWKIFPSITQSGVAYQFSNGRIRNSIYGILEEKEYDAITSME